MLYTKKGDCGISATISDNGLPKDNIVFDLLGTIDELNSHLAVARANSVCGTGDMLKDVQKELIYVSVHIAGGENFDYSAAVSRYETCIDAVETQIKMPDCIKVFGDCPEEAYIDLCRSVCRRCERVAVSYVRESGFDTCLVSYLNRLSDYLFALSLMAKDIRGD